ncbi:MAG: AmmeMemoRadiSam system radical SAM enzyme [Acidobacteriota bacterium]
MSSIDPRRRRVLQCLLAGGCAACLSEIGSLGSVFAQDEALGPPLVAPEGSDLPLHPARWWKEIEGGRIECELCPKKCRVADLERGACGVRENRKGRYYTLTHSRPCSIHLDPIEKKPFNHVLPGTQSLSLATPGCNIECKFCQNWQIAQVRPEQVPTFELRPEQVAALALKHEAPTIACTYTEPVIFAEYVYDIAVAAKKAGVLALMVSNGFILEKPLLDLIEVLGAVKVDLKAYTGKFYKEVCGGELEPVLEALRRLRKKGMWTEIVVLIIPTLNDGDEEIRGLARFVRNDLGAEVPVHFNRFHPSYRIKNLPRTPVATLDRARNIAMAEGLEFVYVGNVPGHPGNNTYCPRCGEIVIRRVGMAMVKNRLVSGRCPDCNRKIPGIWSVDDAPVSRKKHRVSSLISVASDEVPG